MSDINPDESVNIMIDTTWDVGEIINEKLAPALDGEPIPKAIVSMLTFILLLMKPDVTPEEAEPIVQATTTYLMDVLKVGEEPMEHEQRLERMN